MPGIDGSTAVCLSSPTGRRCAPMFRPSSAPPISLPCSTTIPSPTERTSFPSTLKSLQTEHDEFARHERVERGRAAYLRGSGAPAGQDRALCRPRRHHRRVRSRRRHRLDCRTGQCTSERVDWNSSTCPRRVRREELDQTLSMVSSASSTGYRAQVRSVDQADPGRGGDGFRTGSCLKMSHWSAKSGNEALDIIRTALRRRGRTFLRRV